MKLKLGEQEVNIGSLMTPQTLGFLTNRFSEEEKSKETAAFEELTKDKKTLIDVGCCYGGTCLLFTKTPDKVAHGIDGSFKSQTALKQTCLLNPQKKIHQYRMLIGRKTGVSRCVFDEHQSLSIPNNNDKEQTVEAIMTLDNFCETFGVVPDVVNIDVEGSEIDVLEGAEQTLEKHRPLVFIEIHKNFLAQFYGKSTMDVYNEFVKMSNYKVFDLNMKEIPLSRYCIYIDNLERESVVNIWIPQ